MCLLRARFLLLLNICVLLIACCQGEESQVAPPAAGKLQHSVSSSITPACVAIEDSVSSGRMINDLGLDHASWSPQQHTTLLISVSGAKCSV